MGGHHWLGKPVRLPSSASSCRSIALILLRRLPHPPCRAGEAPPARCLCLVTSRPLAVAVSPAWLPPAACPSWTSTCRWVDLEGGQGNPGFIRIAAHFPCRSALPLAPSGALSSLQLQSLAQGLFVGGGPAVAVAAPAVAAEGHSSGRSGSGHLDPMAVKKEGASCQTGAAPTFVYRHGGRVSEAYVAVAQPFVCVLMPPPAAPSHPPHSRHCATERICSRCSWWRLPAAHALLLPAPDLGGG